MLGDAGGVLGGGPAPRVGRGAGAGVVAVADAVPVGGDQLGDAGSAFGGEGVRGADLVAQVLAALEVVQPQQRGGDVGGLVVQQVATLPAVLGQ